MADLNRTSRRITQEAAQGGSQAMLYATGLTEADMNKAQVGIASMWYDGNPCNMHLNDLAARVKEGIVPPIRSENDSLPRRSRIAPIRRLGGSHRRHRALPRGSARS